jgi:hypothetical protein
MHFSFYCYSTIFFTLHSAFVFVFELTLTFIILSNGKHVLVSTVLNQSPINIDFRRYLNEHKWNLWIHLCE